MAVSEQALIEVEIALRQSGDTATADKIAAKLKLIEKNSLQLAETQNKVNQAIANGETEKAAKLEAQANRQIASLQKLEKEATNLAEGASKTGDKAKSLQDGLGELGGAANKISPELGNVVGKLENLASIGGPAGIVIGALVAIISGAVGIAIAATGANLDYAKSINEITKSTGASTETASLFATLLGRTGGEAKDAIEPLKNVGKSIQESIANPASEGAKNLAAFGISAKDSAGKAKSIDDVLKEIDKSAQGTALSQEQLLALTGLLGEEGSKKLTPFIGRFGELTEKAKAAGLVLGGDTLAQAQKLSTELGDFQEMIKGLAVTVGGQFLDSFQAIITQVKIAQESLSNNETFTSGIQALIDVTKDFISNFGPDVVTTIEGILEAIGLLGKAVGNVKETYDFLKESIFGVTPAIEKTSQSVSMLADMQARNQEAAKASAQALDGLKTSLANVAAQVTANLAVEQALINLRIQGVEASLKKQVTSEIEAAQQIGDLRIQSAQKNYDTTINNLNALERVKAQFQAKGGEQLRQFLLDEAKAQQANVTALEQLNKAKLDKVDSTNAAILKSAMRTSAEEIADSNNSKALLLAQIQELSDRKIDNAQTTAAKIRVVENAARDEQIKILDQQLAKAQQNAGLNKDLIINLNQQKTNLIAQGQVAEVQASTTTRNAVVADETTKFNAFKANLDARQIAEDQAFNESLDRLRKRGADEITIAKITDEYKLKSLRNQIDAIDAETAAKAKQPQTEAEIQNQINKRRVLENQISDIINKRTGAVAEELKKETEGVRNLGDATDQLTAKYQSLATATDAVQANIGKLANAKIFDATKASIEEIKKEIEDLYADAQTLQLINQAASQSFADSAEALQKTLNQRLSDSANKLYQENLARANAEYEQKRALAEKTAEAIFKLERESRQKLKDIEEQAKTDTDKINNDRITENSNYQQKILDDNKAYKTKSESLESEHNKKIAEEDERANNEALARQRAYNAQKADLATELADTVADLFRKNKVTQAELQDQIDKLNPTTDKAKIDALKAQQAQSQAAVDRATRKEAEIKAAGQKAGSAEEFNILKAAIEKKYEVEAEGIDQAAKLRALGREKEAQEVEKSIKEQQDRDAKATEEKIARLKFENDLKAKDLEKQRQQELDAYNQSQKDLKDSFDQASAIRDKAHQDRLKQLDDQNADILRKENEAKKAVVDAEQKGLEDIAKQAGLTKTAFDDLLDTSTKKTKDFNAVLDEALKKITGLGQAASQFNNSGNSGSGGGNGNNGSNGSGGGNNNNGNTIDVGTTSSNNNSNSFTTGLQSANITKQPEPGTGTNNSNQGGGTGKNKGNSQQPGSTGLQDDNQTKSPSTSISTIAEFKQFADRYYKDNHRKAVAGKRRGKQFFDRVVGDFQAAAENLGKALNKKKTPLQGVLSYTKQQAENIVEALDGVGDPKIDRQYFDQNVDNIIRAIDTLPEEDKQNEDQPGSGSLGKGGNFSTPGNGQGGVGKGQGGGDLNTGVTSKTIKGTQSNPRNKGEDRSGLEEADRQATKGAGQGIDDVSVGFANNPDSKTGGFGTGNSKNTTSTTNTNANTNTTQNNSDQGSNNQQVMINFNPQLQIINSNSQPDPDEQAEMIVNETRKQVNSPEYIQMIKNQLNANTRQTTNAKFSKQIMG